jgi:GT2 family glycosyltransferase
MNLSIVIPFYENLADLLKCVNTLGSSSTGGLELVIQDDHSRSVNISELHLPGSIERNAVNMGFAATCNRGAQRAHGDIIAFVNQDVMATPQHTPAGWDRILLSVFDDPRVGIVAPRLLFPDGSVQSVGGLLDARCTPFHPHLGWSQPDMCEETSTQREMTWATGAVLFIRRELFWKVGGFDLRYSPSYFEDVDLALQVRELGYKVIVEPSVTFVHAVGSTGGSPHFQRSALRFKEKWVDTGRAKPDVNYLGARYW